MKTKKMLYRNLAARMALLGINRGELSHLMGVNYSTLENKLRGKTAFTLDQAVQIKRILRCTAPLEDLFARDAPEDAAEPITGE